MKRLNIIADLIYWTHSIIVLGWFALFFVPTGIWNVKIAFHFIVTAIIIGHQLLWGAILGYRTGKFHLVCILTTAMHMARGENFDTDRNYTHKWGPEFCEKIGIPISSSIATSISLIGLIVVSAQYFLLL